MKISEIPVIILAAGKGTRLRSEFDGKNKALLPFNEDYTLLDLLLHRLISFGVKSIVIIGGYRFDIIKDYITDLKRNFRNKMIFEEISKKFIQCKIKIIKARDDYEKGPLYTLLTLSKHIFEQKINSNIQDQLLSSDCFASDHLNQSQYFTIIPSDTVFSNELLQKIMNTELFKQNIKKKKKLNQENSDCHLFGLLFSREKLKEMKTKKKFSGSYLEFRQGKLDGIKNFTDYNPKDTAECLIQIPIVVISKKFIKFTETLLNSKINKLAMAINEFRKINNISTHIIQLEKNSDFFTDVDTIKNYKKLKEKIDDF